MTNTIYSTFSDPEMAKRAAGSLLDYGVKPSHISIVFPSGYRPGDGSPEDLEDSAEHGITTTTAGDAASGAAKGAGIGLAVGAAAALAAVLVPGVGLVVGGGALAMAAAGAAGATVAGAAAGGVTGFLKDQGVPDDDLETYNKTLQGGGAIMTVVALDETVGQATVEEVLRKYSGTISLYPVKN